MEDQIIILGAGVSGLTAARTLKDHGRNVLLVDKGRGVGGRVATRWMGERDNILGRWDHGAQFATFRSRPLIEKLKEWEAWDVMKPWIPSYSDPSLLRNRPTTGMNAFPKALAEGLKIKRGHRITRIQKSGDVWTVQSEDNEPLSGTTLFSTLPIPQFLDLAEASSFSLTSEESSLLRKVRYDRTLTLLAELDGPSGLKENGYVRVSSSGILESLIDQHQKDISPAHTLVAHANAPFSLEWYDRDRAAAASVIRAAVQQKVSSQITSVQIHGWKFAKAKHRIPDSYMKLGNGCFLAGDGFMAGDRDVPGDLHSRIESAMLSGKAAAEAYLNLKG